jgi:hypothetical protein
LGLRNQDSRRTSKRLHFGLLAFKSSTSLLFTDDEETNWSISGMFNIGYSVSSCRNISCSDKWNVDQKAILMLNVPVRRYLIRDKILLEKDVLVQ